jgi:DoxX-like family
MNSRLTKIIYWITTGFIFLFDGVVPAFTSNSQVAVDAIRHLGYPDYFRNMLTVFKVAGALVLILPIARGRIKEWAYAGFGITYIAATVSNWALNGLTGLTLFPILVFAILIVSYICYQKIYKKSGREM